MTEADRPPDLVQGVEAVLLANRVRLLGFLEARGAGDAAEDIFQELWMRVTERSSGPIADPLSYLFRAANNLMLDRYRSARQAGLREQAWGEATAAAGPSAEHALLSREELAGVERTIDELGERPARIFRRFRVDGIGQREIAAEMGISLSTVEADLRKAYAAILAYRRQFHA